MEQSVPRSYTDLRLELRDLGEDRTTFVVALSGASVGEVPPVPVALDLPRLTPGLRGLRGGGIPASRSLVSFGAAVGDLLLPDGPIRTAVAGSVRTASLDQGIRLRLVTSDPVLAHIPWEYAHLPTRGCDHPADFLVLDPAVSIVRHEALPLPHHPVVAARDRHRMKVVAVLANVPDLPELRLDRERRAIESALAATPEDVAVDLTAVLENPSAEEVRTALRHGADIFHFAGHGSTVDGGCLALPLPNADRSDRLGAGELAALLRQAGVRLAVLGACDSGARTARSPWHGLAAALTSTGTPAVIGMQFPVVDGAASRFAGAVYRVLAAAGTIDEAVMLGRTAMAAGRVGAGIWGIPVLYSRAADGVLFPPPNVLEPRTTTLRQTVSTVGRDAAVTGIKLRHATDAGGPIVVQQTIETVHGRVVGIEMG